MKGPNLFRGYWNKPEATAEVLVDGWLATGDLGRIDDEGFLYIEDRAKDMVLRGGENVYSAEVESAIYEHPDVYEAAVFGVPDERLGEEVATVITRRPGSTLDAEELRRFLGGKLSPFKIPSRIAFSESDCRGIPRARSSSESCGTRTSLPRHRPVQRCSAARFPPRFDPVRDSGIEAALQRQPPTLWKRDRRAPYGHLRTPPVRRHLPRPGLRQRRPHSG